MTLLSNIGYVPRRTTERCAEPIVAREISVVVPVKDNEAGIARIEYFDAMELEKLPLEVIIVDNNSRNPLDLQRLGFAESRRCRLLHCGTPGPAAARNRGGRVAGGKWLLFIDSDCIPTDELLAGFVGVADGSVGYAGMVKALRTDSISQYYESQEILLPRHIDSEDGVRRPHYLITANALVLASAFAKLNGFDEHFERAAGEDVDFGFRLSELGTLAYAPQATVLHDFEADEESFRRRFERYGAGNKRLAELYPEGSFEPDSFAPNVDTPYNQQLARIQYESLRNGFYSTAADDAALLDAYTIV